MTPLSAVSKCTVSLRLKALAAAHIGGGDGEEPNGDDDVDNVHFCPSSTARENARPDAGVFRSAG